MKKRYLSFLTAGIVSAMLLAFPGRVMAEEIPETKLAAEKAIDSESSTVPKENPDASQDEFFIEITTTDGYVDPNEKAPATEETDSSDEDEGSDILQEDEGDDLSEDPDVNPIDEDGGSEEDDLDGDDLDEDEPDEDSIDGDEEEKDAENSDLVDGEADPGEELTGTDEDPIEEDMEEDDTEGEDDTEDFLDPVQREQRNKTLDAEAAYEAVLEKSGKDSKEAKEAARQAADSLVFYWGENSANYGVHGGGWWYELSGSRSCFTGLELNGVLLDPSDYHLSENCDWTRVTFDIWYLEDYLPMGENTLTFHYSYGSIETTLTRFAEPAQIPPKMIPSSVTYAGPSNYTLSQSGSDVIAQPVQTGDPGMAAYAVELILSLGSAGGISVARAGIKRRKREKK